jgi:hypothetical protein
MTNRKAIEYRWKQAEFGLGLVDLAKNAPKDQARFLAEAAARALKQSITTRPQYPG